MSSTSSELRLGVTQRIAAPGLQPVGPEIPKSRLVEAFGLLPEFSRVVGTLGAIAEKDRDKVNRSNIGLASRHGQASFVMLAQGIKDGNIKMGDYGDDPVEAADNYVDSVLYDPDGTSRYNEAYIKQYKSTVIPSLSAAFLDQDNIAKHKMEREEAENLKSFLGVEGDIGESRNALKSLYAMRHNKEKTKLEVFTNNVIPLLKDAIEAQDEEVFYRLNSLLEELSPNASSIKEREYKAEESKVKSAERVRLRGAMTLAFQKFLDREGASIASHPTILKQFSLDAGHKTDLMKILNSYVTAKGEITNRALADFKKGNPSTALYRERAEDLGLEGAALEGEVEGYVKEKIEAIAKRGDVGTPEEYENGEGPVRELQGLLGELAKNDENDVFIAEQWREYRKNAKESDTKVARDSVVTEVARLLREGSNAAQFDESKEMVGHGLTGAEFGFAKKDIVARAVEENLRLISENNRLPDKKEGEPPRSVEEEMGARYETLKEQIDFLDKAGVNHPTMRNTFEDQSSRGIRYTSGDEVSGEALRAFETYKTARELSSNWLAKNISDDADRYYRTAQILEQSDKSLGAKGALVQSAQVSAALRENPDLVKEIEKDPAFQAAVDEATWGRSGDWFGTDAKNSGVARFEISRLAANYKARQFSTPDAIRMAKERFRETHSIINGYLINTQDRYLPVKTEEGMDALSKFVVDRYIKNNPGVEDYLGDIDDWHIRPEGRDQTTWILVTEDGARIVPNAAGKADDGIAYGVFTTYELRLLYDAGARESAKKDMDKAVAGLAETRRRRKRLKRTAADRWDLPQVGEVKKIWMRPWSTGIVDLGSIPTSKSTRLYNEWARQSRTRKKSWRPRRAGKIDKTVEEMAKARERLIRMGPLPEEPGPSPEREPRE